MERITKSEFSHVIKYIKRGAILFIIIFYLYKYDYQVLVYFSPVSNNPTAICNAFSIF
jgi:hypothetical protein